MIRFILRTRFAYQLRKKLFSLKYVKIYLRENSTEKKHFLKNISHFKINQINSKSSNVLVQQLDSYELTLKIATIVKAYSLNNSIKVYSYQPHFNKKLGWINYEERNYFFFFKTFNKKLYKTLGYTFLFDLDERYSSQDYITEKYKQIIRLIKCKEDVLNIKIDGVHVGDLIYDTYLRYYSNHTLENINDPKLKDVIYYAIDNYYLIKKYISKKSIKVLFTTYTTYISNGLAVRICIDKNIPVYSCGSNSYYFQRVEREYTYHIQKYWNFSYYKLLDWQNQEVEKELSYRFSGGIDQAISYMKKSSFVPKSKDSNYFADSRRRNVVIYVHDIYDSPHVFKNFLYTDFYTFILDLSKQIKEDKFTRYYFKFHPNAIGDSNEKVSDFLKSLNSDSIRLLPLEVSNLDIIDFKPDLVVTVNGTVGLEMAYFKIPVVALIDNLYMNFSFVHTCFTLQEYYKIILGVEKVNVKFDLLEIYSFYYQSYRKSLVDIDKRILELVNIQQNTSSDFFLQKVNENFDYHLFDKLFVKLQTKFL